MLSNIKARKKKHEKKKKIKIQIAEDFFKAQRDVVKVYALELVVKIKIKKRKKESEDIFAFERW